MEKIGSGQSFLYRRGGYDSTVIEIRMKDWVVGRCLQAALTDTARRFPYMTERLVEKDGSYFLHRNNIPMMAAKTHKFRPLGDISTGYHLIDVTYIGNLIRVAFHHGLCDGKGIMPFVETLLYEYCSQRYHKHFSTEGLRLPGEMILPEETMEPFSDQYFDVDETAVQSVEKDGYALPEGTPSPEVCYGTEFILDESRFVNAARSIGATPSTFAAMIVSDVILSLNTQADKPVICNLAMDLRSAVDMELTHRNCVGSAYLPFTEKDRQDDRRSVAEKYRKLLAAQRTPDAVKATLNKQIGLFNRLDELNTIEEKREMLSFFNGLISNTYVISYLGRLRLNDYAQYVESARFFSDTICGLSINMLAAAGKLSLEVLQGFSEQRYVRELKRILVPYGLLSATDTHVVTTGKDMSFITAAQQTEGYYKKAE